MAKRQYLVSHSSKVNMVLTKGFICTHSIFLYISKKTLDNDLQLKLNKFLFFKLPAAFICGVRVKKLDEKECVATVSNGLTKIL
jgi:hypothetical protein